MGALSPAVAAYIIGVTTHALRAQPVVDIRLSPYDSDGAVTFELSRQRGDDIFSTKLHTDRQFLKSTYIGMSELAEDHVRGVLKELNRRMKI